MRPSGRSPEMADAAPGASSVGTGAPAPPLPRPGHLPRSVPLWATASRPWAVPAAVLAAAVLLRFFLLANTDVSWLLTVAERVLDGQRLYIDVIETNPPAAVLLYLP